MSYSPFTATGNGSTTAYTIAFDYITTADVKASINEVVTTAFSVSGSTVTFNTAPPSGQTIKIFRDTDNQTIEADFQSGSALRAIDLNSNFTQLLYVSQESTDLSDTATTNASTAVTTANTASTNATNAVNTANTASTNATNAVNTANTADTNATTALSTANNALTAATNATTTANTAATDASSAVSTANTASTNASSAVTTANTASTNATAAVNTANTASTNASAAVNTANTAATTANSAATDAASAITTANSATSTANTALANAATATTTANGAVTTANTALTNASAAVTTANTASSTATTAATNASAAVTTANSASATATAAQNAVAGAAFYSPVANVAGIPGSPSDNDRVEVADSTGIQSFSPLTGYPAGFTGASGLTARIQYSSSGSTWNWVDYFANDPEDRYYTKTSGTTNATNIATKMPLAGGTFTGAVSFDDNVIVKGDATNGSGKLTLNCENNSHGIHIKGPPHSAGANYTLTLPNDTGTSGQALKTDGSGALSFADVSSSFITQTDFAYKPTSNSLTFNDGLNSTPGSTSSEFSFYTTATNGNFSFMPTNAFIKSNMEALQVGDSVTLDWTLPNGTTASQTTTVTIRTAQPIPSGSYGTVVFANAPTYHSSSAATVKLTCSRISNGVEPITNNQVLRYKTATQKWTVDSAEVIAICDGGNFANGSSLVQTSTTFDGGSF